MPEIATTEQQLEFELRQRLSQAKNPDNSERTLLEAFSHFRAGAELLMQLQGRRFGYLRHFACTIVQLLSEELRRTIGV